MTPYHIQHSDEALEDDKEFEILSGADGEEENDGNGKSRKRKPSNPPEDVTLYANNNNKKIKLDALEV